MGDHDDDQQHNARANYYEQASATLNNCILVLGIILVLYPCGEMASSMTEEDIPFSSPLHSFGVDGQSSYPFAPAAHPTSLYPCYHYTSSLSLVNPL